MRAGWKRICLWLLLWMALLPAGRVFAAGSGTKVQLPVNLGDVGEIPAVGTGSLPASFDARKKGWITPARDQGTSGTCWAFSAVSAAETSMIRQGIQSDGAAATASSLDLSELQLLYFFYHNVTDDFGGTAGDQTNPLTSSILDQGGNGIFTTFALASWLGVVPENLLPYSQANKAIAEGLPIRMARAMDVAHLQNSYWIPMTEKEAIKGMIYKYGNVSVNIYFNKDKYYRAETSAYYNPVVLGVTHAVNIVGWDDNYSRENFEESNRPSSDGAWLARNNWGQDWGDAGYFWISYEEKSLTGNNNFGFIYEFEPANNYEYIYQYDGSASYKNKSASLKVMETGESVANRFVVQGSDSETLKAVSLACYSPNTRYSLQIYKNPDKEDPESGIPMLQTPQTGTIAYTGYVTIPLQETDVIFQKGDSFSVVFTLTSSDGSNVEVFLDKTLDNGGWIGFVNATQIGESYYKDGPLWKDLGKSASGSALGTQGATVRIKAFTDRCRTGQVGDILMSESNASIAIGETLNLDAIVAPASLLNTYTPHWFSDNPAVATVQDGRVTGVGLGTANITVRVGGAHQTCKVSVGLGTPSLSDAAGTGYGKITVSWTPVSGADGYRIYRKKSGSYKKLADISGQEKTSYVDKVSNTNTYTYTVRAYKKADGDVIWSDYVKKGINGAAVPQEVKLTDAVSVKKGIKLTWEKIPGSGYRIYRKSGSSGWKSVKTISSSKTLTWTDKKVSYGTKYKYTICGYFKSGSKKIYGTYDTKGVSVKRVPGTPKLVSTAVSGKKIKVTWKKAFGAKGYVIYRKKVGGKYKEIGTVKGASTRTYKDKKAKKGVTYYYTVRAYRMVAGERVLGGYVKKGISGSR